MNVFQPNGPIEPTTLRGDRVVLEPLAVTHLPGLAVAVDDGELWRIPFTMVPKPEELPDFLATAETRQAAHLDLPFAIVDIPSGAVVGSTRFMNINRHHRRVEIGFTFVARSWQRTHVNTEAKFLLLRHAFESWQCNRVELITDVLNERSRSAIRRVGAREEGILRCHMVMREGRVRDSIMHSVVVADWPQVKSSLEALLIREPS